MPPRGADDGIPDHIYAIFDTLGSYTLIAVLTFGAYTLGMIFMMFMQPAYARLSAHAKVGSRTYANQIATNLFAQIPALGDDRGGSDQHALTALWGQVSSRPIDANDHNLEESVHRRISSALREGLEDAAVILQTKNRELWDIYDRGSAEAQFRFGIAIPFGVTAGLIASQIFGLAWHWSLSIALASSAIMFFLSAQKLRESFSALRQGLEAADIKSRKHLALERVIAEINRL